MVHTMIFISKKKRLEAAQSLLDNYVAVKRMLVEQKKGLSEYLDELEKLTEQTRKGFESLGLKPDKCLELVRDKDYLAKVRQYNIYTLGEIADHVIYEIEEGGYRSCFAENMKRQFIREMRIYVRNRLAELRLGKSLYE